MVQHAWTGVMILSQNIPSSASLDHLRPLSSTFELWSHTVEQYSRRVHTNALYTLILMTFDLVLMLQQLIYLGRNNTNVFFQI